jgi:hypothetical protein
VKSWTVEGATFSVDIEDGGFATIYKGAFRYLYELLIKHDHYLYVRIDDFGVDLRHIGDRVRARARIAWWSKRVVLW